MRSNAANGRQPEKSVVDRATESTPAETPWVIQVRWDRLAVDLEVRAPLAGGHALSLEKIKEELAQRQIVFGFDDQSLAAALAELAAKPQGVGKVRLAEGVAPVAGGRGRLEYLVGPAAANPDPAALDLVRPGQVVVRRVKAPAGIPGRDIFGEEITAAAGHDPPLLAGEHVRLGGEDDTEYQAGIYGRVLIGGGSIAVLPLVEIDADGMSAWLPIFPRLADNSALEYADLEQSLQVAGVVHGIREEAIRAALEQQSVIPRLLAAGGEVPVDGKDAAVAFSFLLNDRDPVKMDEAHRAGKLAAGAVYRSLRLGGESLAVKTPAVEPIAGRKVTGESIGGRVPRDFILQPGENVELSDDGLTLTVAEQLVAGYPDYQGGAVSVSDPLRLSDDAMTAFLEIHPPGPGGRGLNGELIRQLLAAHGVSHGVRKKHIRRAVEFAAAEHRILPRVVVARGREPEHGREAEIEVLVKVGKSSGRIIEPSDTIEFRERSAISSVKKGDLLARRTPPEPGMDGWTVRGEVVVAKPGADLLFQPQPGVVISDDNLQLLAGGDGMITILAPNKIAVYEIFEVKGDVDYRLGNLDMAGTLTISGWIRPGFTVRASGDIRVAGGVEDGKLVAGANVVIAGGMISRGQGRIRAESDVSVRFLEQTRVRAGGNVVVRDQVMRSQIFAGGMLTVTAGRGRIRGGVSSAIQGIMANEIGSPAGVRTVVMAGANPALRRRLLQVNRQMAGYARQRAKMDTVLGRFLKHGRTGSKLPPEVQRKLSLLVKQRRTMAQAEGRLTRPREEMARELAAIDLRNIKISVKNTVYAGTVVVIGRVKQVIREDLRRPVTFTLDRQGREIEQKS